MLLSMHITFEHYQSRTSRRIDLLHDLGVGFTACLLFARAGEACGPHATHATQAYQGKQREGNDPIQRERGPQAQANDTEQDPQGTENLRAAVGTVAAFATAEAFLVAIYAAQHEHNANNDLNGQQGRTHGGVDAFARIDARETHTGRRAGGARDAARLTG